MIVKNYRFRSLGVRGGHGLENIIVLPMDSMEVKLAVGRNYIQ